METLRFRMRGEMAVIQSRVYTTKSEGFWSANRYEDLKAAVAEGRPFEGHQIVGMKPVPIVINPAHVITVEPADPGDDVFGNEREV